MKNYAKISYSDFFGKYIVKFCSLLDNGVEIENPRIVFNTEKGDSLADIKAGLIRSGFGENDIVIL